LFVPAHAQPYKPADQHRERDLQGEPICLFVRRGLVRREREWRQACPAGTVPTVARRPARRDVLLIEQVDRLTARSASSFSEILDRADNGIQLPAAKAS
jgi:hypothetical protein